MELNRMIIFSGNLKRLPQLFIIAIILVAGIATTGVMAHDANKQATVDKLGAGSVQQFAVETLRIPDVPVIDSNYNTRGFVSRFADKGTIVISLTYTGCETLCPVSNVILQQLDRSLAGTNTPSMKIVTLSIDPEMDTPETLRVAAKKLQSSEHWTWLTASAQHSRMLLDSLDVDVGALEEHDPMFLIGKVSTGRFIRVIGMPDPDQLLAISRSELL